MGVVVPVVALAAGRVNVHVRHHALAGNLFAHPILNQPFALLVGQLVGQRNSDFTGELGAVGTVAIVLAALDFIPELLPVLCPFGRVLGPENAGELTPFHTAIIFLQAGALVLQLGPGIIRGLGDGALTLPPRNDMGVEMKYRHSQTAAPISLTPVVRNPAAIRRPGRPPAVPTARLPRQGPSSAFAALDSAARQTGGLTARHCAAMYKCALNRDLVFVFACILSRNP